MTTPYPFEDLPEEELADLLGESDPLIDEINAMFDKDHHPYDYMDVALTDPQLREMPPPKELVPGWTALVGVSGIWAPPGYMKTFILTGMAKAVRRGKRWQHKTLKITRKGAVLFFEGEIPQQLAVRQEAFDLRYPLKRGTESPQLTIPATPDLTKAEGVAAVLRTAEAFQEKLRADGDELVMIVFDPLPEYFSGEEVGDGLVRAVRALCWLAERLQCAIVVGHQSNASGERARGHDIFRQKLFILSHIERPEPDLIALVQDKNKFRPELAMTLAITEVGESLVLEYDRGGDFELLAHEYLAEKEIKVTARRKRKQAVVESDERTKAKQVAAAVFQEKGAFPSLRRVMAAMAERDASLTERACRTAIDSLLNEGAIEVGEAGTRSSREHRWVQ